MGDGIGGPVVKCLSGNAFELDVTHFRKDNQEQYSRIEKIIISKIDNPEIQLSALLAELTKFSKK